MAKRTRAPARRPRATALTSSAPRTEKATQARRVVYTAELLAYARFRYEHTPDRNVDIAIDLGVHRDTFRRLAKREGWKRYVQPPHDLMPAARLRLQAQALDRHPEVVADDGAGPAGPAVPAPASPAAVQAERAAGETASAAAESNEPIPPLTDTIARLHRAILHELAAVEKLHAQIKGQPLTPIRAERTARALSTLTETLRRLQSLQCTTSYSGPDDDDMPADIDEFRNELARRIEEFVASRTGPPDGGAPAAAAVAGEAR